MGGVAVFITEYIKWHYGGAFRDLFSLWKNFLWFGYHLFSLPVFLRTLFAPFYRIKETYRGGLDWEAMLESLVANVVARGVGFLLRIFMLAFGFAFEGAILFLLAPVFIAWVFLPFLIAGLLVVGFSTIF